jgi:hypothetical protein
MQGNVGDQLQARLHQHVQQCFDRRHQQSLKGSLVCILFEVLTHTTLQSVLAVDGRAVGDRKVEFGSESVEIFIVRATDVKEARLGGGKVVRTCGLENVQLQKTDNQATTVRLDSLHPQCALLCVS